MENEKGNWAQERFVILWCRFTSFLAYFGAVMYRLLGLFNNSTDWEVRWTASYYFIAVPLVFATAWLIADLKTSLFYTGLLTAYFTYLQWGSVKKMFVYLFR